MSNDFFSNAHNFQSAATGRVDPRTGLFNYLMPVAHIVGNNAHGPEQAISLSYSPLNNEDIGFGIGFVHAFTQYDTTKRLLMLSTGERYKVYETDDKVFLKQYKQNTVRVEKDTTQNIYRVIHKSGMVEILTGPEDVFDFKVTKQIINPLGYTLKLNWNYDLGPVPRLISITDQEQALLQIHYEPDDYTRITVWPTRSESYDIQFFFENNYVTRVENNADSAILKWEMEYDGSSNFLTKVSSPTGSIDQVNYDPDGHQFPEGANLPAIPYVDRYIQSSGHGADIVQTYQYTNTNFLGYGGEGDWNSDDDYLYSVLSNYEYGSTESHEDGSTLRTITRRYNNYHLLTSETTQQGSCKRIHKTDYYAQFGTAFEDQPPQFQHPKSATSSFNDTDIGETVQTQFDAAGNLTMQITADGTRTDWEYYPAEGEKGACPASPHGFVHFIKSKTVTPGHSFPEGAYDDAPVHKVVYQYAELETLPGTPSAHAVADVYQAWYSADQLLHEIRKHYVNDVTSPEHGYVHRIDEIVYPRQDTAQFSEGTVWKTSQTISYTVQNETLIKSVTWTGHDQLNITTQHKKSRFSGKLWHETDAHGNTSSYHYDSLGRILKHISNVKTQYTQEINYAYEIEKQGMMTTTQTDVWGNQSRTRLDGLGHAYQKEILEKGKESEGWRLVSEIERDSWGRVISQTHHDWLPMSDDPENVTKMSVSQHIEYDNWGHAYRVIQDSGESIQQDYDPITRTLKKTIYAKGLNFSSSIVKYDKRHHPVTITHYDSQGKQYSQQANHYDGLGRLRASIDELGQKTEYTYDTFSRVKSIKQSDGTVVRKSYAPFSTGSLLTQIAVDSHVLGTRNFDSLHRNTTTTIGGRNYLATYQGIAPFPDTITGPSGQTVKHQYEPLLGNVLTKVDAGEIQQDFEYDAKTGAMTQSSASHVATRGFNYTASGQLQEETFRFDDINTDTERKTEYTYSPVGKMTGYRDITGKTRSMSFDKYGRSSAISDPDIRIDLNYDAASRVNSWNVHDRKNNKKVTTALQFDDFGREINRQIQTETDTLTLKQDYNVKGQVITRTTQSHQAGILRQESYTYDPARNWLTDYHCSGVECPRDAYGFPIARQSFTYDILGNIQTCITTHADGSSDTAMFTYSSVDPCQLSRITHTHPGYPPTISLMYDKAGHLLQDESSRHLAYDTLGRLKSVHSNGAASHYTYDAGNRLVLQQTGSDKTHELYYIGKARVAEIQREGNVITRLLSSQGEMVATVIGEEAHLLGVDGHSSVLVSNKSDGTQTRYRYSPYGQQAEEEHNADLPAYNGERYDPIGGGYHLGNGYRAYNPVLMRFNAPDSWSPFGAGGINSYAYCLGDPINRTDPSGHISIGSIFGLIFGAIGIVVGVIAAIPTGGLSLGVIAGVATATIGIASDATSLASISTANSDPHTSAVLGWVSLGLGLLSMSGSAFSIARGIQKSLTRARAAFSEGLSGRQGGSAEVRDALYGSGTRRNDPYIVSSFHHLRNMPRIGVNLREVESPIGSGTHTLEHHIFGAPDHEINMVENQFRFERVAGENTLRVNNRVDLYGGFSRHVDITADIYENLYLKFIRRDTVNALGNNPISEISFNRIFLDLHLDTVSNITQDDMNIIRTRWSRFNFNKTFKEWSLLYLENRYRRDYGTILNLSRNIGEDDIHQLFNFVMDPTYQFM
ncbi:RHS repeat domain-containing protein [Xenorhabdus innexi]|uniref:Putative Nematicidal protein 2 n=1 Tax=Xenorhabdus innexi TaxID=290109 RepID=A0A1N6MXM1_9GAMM|nr:RHS repeat-associated core domain-containing protein [Xenorhabdus innexi]PHM29998.1 RHS repeat-associated core domain-containing protein [Xenorhabdus innexi]SIP73590.1 putative Nematicidal protein 2 [Xenorhabdus innexi]